jgi:predicted dienelactone hydrolase
MAEDPPEGFEKMIDAEHAGTIGYSFDGTNSFSLSGARVDPQYYLSQCPEPDETTKAFVSYLSAFDCAPAEAWEEMEDAAGEMITASQDGLWQPITDDRIRAVMPMAGEGWWWFGERGLAAADRPMLLLAGTADELYKENALIYEHLGTADKRFISFIGQGHMEMLDEPQISGMAHLANAFFGYYLQGKTELEKYFSEKYIERQDGLAWGVYSDE